MDFSTIALIAIQFTPFGDLIVGVINLCDAMGGSL